MTTEVRANPPAEESNHAPVLLVEDVVVGYTDLDILKGVSIKVGRDEIVVIIGPNGAGKSTLAKTICGLLVPRSGQIRFEGESLVQLPPSAIVQRGLCYVPQERNVFPNLTVKENLEMGGYLLSPALVKERIEEMLEIFPALRSKLEAKAGTLSGGQRQMLAMGRALMLKPRLLVLDEPSAGLSPQMVDMVFDKITEINRNGCAILMVEQNARKALAMCHRGYVLDMGRNAITNTGKALLEDPEVIRLYLGKLHKASS